MPSQVNSLEFRDPGKRTPHVTTWINSNVSPNMLGELVFQFSRGKSRLLCWKKKKKPFSGRRLNLLKKPKIYLSLVNIRQKKHIIPVIFKRINGG